MAFAFLAAEIYFRLFSPQDLIKPMSAQLDQEIIYTLRPNFESYLKGSSTRMFHLKTNSLGLREREIPFDKPENIFRILLLGDSMSMAEGVELEETYLKKMELVLRAHQIRNIETINAAIRGYGNDQELILFHRIGEKYNPDIVILAFSTANDMRDNWKGQLFRLEKGGLIQQPATVASSEKYRFYSKMAKIQNMPGWNFIMSRFHLANWLRVTIGKIVQYKIYGAYGKIDKNLEKIPLEDRPAFHLTLAILRQWNRDVEKLGARPFIMVIPKREDIEDLRTRLKADIIRLDLALENFCQIEKIPFLNLTHNMVKWQGDFESLWLECGHLSPNGHALIAQILFDSLRSNNLFPPK